MKCQGLATECQRLARKCQGSAMKIQWSLSKKMCLFHIFLRYRHSREPACRQAGAGIPCSENVILQAKPELSNRGTRFLPLLQGAVMNKF